MSSPEEQTGFSDTDRWALRVIAQQSIAHGVRHARPLAVDPLEFSPLLRAPAASFVTLRRAAQLRGCVGSLDVERPLIADVAHNAFAAAFHDPRFPPVADHELEDLTLSISVLSPWERIVGSTRAEVEAQIRVGLDGVVLTVAALRATLLPSMWDRVSDAGTFLDLLLHKANLPRDYWSQELEFWRYTTETVQ